MFGWNSLGRRWYISDGSFERVFPAVAMTPAGLDCLMGGPLDKHAGNRGYQGFSVSGHFQHSAICARACVLPNIFGSPYLAVLLLPATGEG